METGNHRVEVYIDGSVVFAMREPGESFAGEPVCSAEDAFRHFQSIQAMPQEVFAVMSLNGANKPIKTRWVTVGLLDCNQVHPREVFADPLMDRAAAIILAHNHPSGTLEPGAEDLALTKRLQKAGELLGIGILRRRGSLLPTDGYPADTCESAFGRPRPRFIVAFSPLQGERRMAAARSRSLGVRRGELLSSVWRLSPHTQTTGPRRRSAPRACGWEWRMRSEHTLQALSHGV